MKRRLAALATAGVALAVAVPSAFADGTSNPVTVTGTTGNGIRQFAVETLGGQALTALNLGKNGTAPFRVRVTDNGPVPVVAKVVNSVLQPDFQVSATMNNLYLKTGDNTYDFSKKLPSSAIGLSYATGALDHAGNSVNVIPTYLLSGTLPTCAELATAIPSLSSVLTNLTGPAAPLCNLLSSGATQISNLPVSGVLKTISIPDGAKVGNLLEQLSGNVPGKFANADYTGIGAGDTSGQSTDSGKVPTALSVLTGTPGITDALQSLINSVIPSQLSSTDVTNTLSTEEIVAALQNATDNSTLQMLGNDLSKLGNNDQIAAILDQLTATLKSVLPTDLSTIGSYFSFPTLTADLSQAPQPGNYAGTMTVTFVQQ